MATPNTTVSTPGYTGTGTNELELFLKVFSGLVLRTFERMAKAQRWVRTRNLSSGRSAQFPAIGTASTSYHTPGEHIFDDANSYVVQVDHGEQVIGVDRLLLGGPVMLSQLDDLMAHYELRSEYASEIGRAMATISDGHLLSLGALAARVASADLPATGFNTGSVLQTNAGSEISDTVAALEKALRVAALKLDENDVPEEDRVVFLRPAQYHMLVEQSDLVNKDFAGGAQGNGWPMGKIFQAQGFTIVKSNNIPSTDTSAGSTPWQHAGATTPDQNDYRGDFSNTLGIAMHRSCLGSVSLLGVRSETEWRMEYQAWALLGKKAVGHGILMPGAAVELNDEDFATSILVNKVDIDTY